MQASYNTQEQTTKQYQQQHEQLIWQNRELQRQYQDLQRQYRELQRQYQEHQRQYQELQRQYRELQRQNTDLQQHAKELDEDRESLLLRLSKIAGSKLVSGNPDIADLSDIYRPTKLCEIYSEIYDNEWTEAFEEFKEGEERQNIDILFSLLKAALEICDEITFNQRDSLLNISFLSKSPAIKRRQEPDITPSITPSYMKTKEEITESGLQDGAHYQEKSQVCIRFVKEEESEMLVDFRKKLLENNLTVMQEELPKFIAKSFNISLTDHAAVEAYIKSCVRICWLAGLQDPRVFIRFDEFVGGEQKFDKTIYREYTKSGPKLDYVVWPPIFLHKDGPLLGKGTAQGMK